MSKYVEISAGGKMSKSESDVYIVPVCKKCEKPCINNSYFDAKNDLVIHMKCMNKKHPFFENSLCLNSFLHRFEIKEEYDNGVLEVCEICHKRKFFKLLDGQLNNKEYMSWHIKSALPPQHPFYEHQHYNPLEKYLLSPYV